MQNTVLILKTVWMVGGGLAVGAAVTAAERPLGLPLWACVALFAAGLVGLYAAMEWFVGDRFEPALSYRLEMLPPEAEPDGGLIEPKAFVRWLKEEGGHYAGAVARTKREVRSASARHPGARVFVRVLKDTLRNGPPGEQAPPPEKGDNTDAN